MAMPLDQQGRDRLALIAGGQQALHDELVSAVAGGGEEGPADHPGPEGVGSRQREREIEDPELVHAGGEVMDGGPSAGHEVQDREHADQRAADVDGGLHDVGPDDRGQPALEGVNQRERVMMAMDAISPVPRAIATTMDTA